MATGLESKQNPRKGPRVTDGVLQPRRCGSSWEWFVQYPRRRITRPVRRMVLVARLAPRRAVRPTLRAPRRARRTAAWVQSVSRSASMGVEGDATLGRDSGVGDTASGRGAASTEDAAARMVGATAKPPKRPSKNVRRSMGVSLSSVRVPPCQTAPTQVRIQLILLSQLQIAPAIALDPVQEGREPRACLDRVRARLRPCTTPLMMSSQPRLFTAPVRERCFDKGAYARSARLKSREESNSTGPPVS
jgi:hypothetical protein